MLALSRFAIQVARRSAFKPQKNAFASFHTGAFRQKEEKVEAPVVDAGASDVGFIEKYQLNDWKVSLPIGLAVSIPALSNGFYVLNAESQLACCFLLFCTSAYKFGGEAIGSYFDARANAILAEHNAVEDANISVAKETLQAHEAFLSVQEDIDAIHKAHNESVELMCKVQSYKLRHKTRETFIKNLEQIRLLEQGYNHELQGSMVKKATNNVRAIIEKGDKSLKDAAFKHALDILSEVSIDESKQDDVSALFSKELHSFAQHLESQQGTIIKLSAEEQKELQAELDAYVKRFDLEHVTLTAPKEVKMELL